jgi:hypothetical protein
MGRRFRVVLACACVVGGVLAVASPATADAPLDTYRCSGTATIQNLGNQGPNFLGPYVVVVTGRDNCSHSGVRDFVQTQRTLINFPLVFCAAPTGLGVRATVTTTNVGTTPDGSQEVKAGGPATTCVAITSPPPPTGTVAFSNVETAHVVSATGRLDRGQVGCDETIASQGTIDYDASPPVSKFENTAISVSCLPS